MANKTPSTIKIKPDPTCKNVTASLTKPMNFYKTLPGPRGETTPQGT